MLQEKMLEELARKTLFERARDYAYEYMDQVNEMDVFPQKKALEDLVHFEEDLASESGSALAILQQLHQYGSPATAAQTGGRYFGFVNGGAVPVSLGAKWLADVWDQNGGLFFSSPINSKLEQVCEKWLKELFNLPAETVAGFVSGSSMANLSALCAARYQLLKNLGWDINANGLLGAPAIRILAHRQVHSSIKKTLAMLGFGYNNIEWLAADDQGRLVLSALPPMDPTCLLLLQAGNANTGSFDYFVPLCEQARAAGAWVHIDGAFGLWAAASSQLKQLTAGIELADSWAVDGHKTLNTPYDSGIVLCRHETALLTALQATGEYLVYSEHRDPMLYGPEMSKRSRAIEMWATMKYLGKAGIDEMVTGFHLKALQLAEGLVEAGFQVINEVVFNQVLVQGANEAATKGILQALQNSGELWLGGTTWNGQAAIRVSICSWKTTVKDIERTLAAFVAARTLIDK